MATSGTELEDLLSFFETSYTLDFLRMQELCPSYKPRFPILPKNVSCLMEECFSISDTIYRQIQSRELKPTLEIAGLLLKHSLNKDRLTSEVQESILACQKEASELASGKPMLSAFTTIPPEAYIAASGGSAPANVQQNVEKLRL